MKNLVRFLAWCLLISLPCLAYGASPIPESDANLVQKRICTFNALLPTDHPRLMLLKDELPQFRTFFNNNVAAKNAPAAFKNLLPNPTTLPLPPEPEILRSTGAERTALWQAGYKLAFNSATQAQRYAFAYLITGENHYGREAARWLLHLSEWDVNGGINIKTNDEAFIQSLRPMIFAYDWAYEALSGTEKAAIQKALGLRLTILYQRITSKFSLTHSTLPDNTLSHPMRFISTLGLGGLVLYQDLPAAPTYLAWAYEYYLRQFPVWGGSDGGWSEGLNYWSTGISQHLLFLEAMRTVNQTEIFQKTFFKNNGYFAIYNLMPYPGSSFGDLCNQIGATPNNTLTIEKYALLYQDPYLEQYCNNVFKKYPSGFSYYEFSSFDTAFHLYRKTQQNVVPADLEQLPRSRYFADIGWVAFHSRLGDAQNDIMLGFKSSPFGSASHSFADQNSFVINAFGEPLAISSGYREWYGSPHHLGWTRTTAAKNAILVNGQGQPICNRNATGKILRFYTGANFDFATGDASAAYQKPVTHALRHILFVNRRYFVIYDELKTSSPATFQWLIHAKEPMQLRDQTINLKKGAANLAVRFFVPAPSQLNFTQTDQFAAPVHPKYTAKMPNEWHVTVSDAKLNREQNFLTLLYPYRTGDEPHFSASLLTTGQGRAITVTNPDSHSSELILLSREAERAVTGESLTFAGLSAVITNQATAKTTSYSFVETTKLQTPDFLFKSAIPVSGELQTATNRVQISLAVHQETILQIRLQSKPLQLTGVAPENWHYDAKQQLLQIKIAANPNQLEIRLN